MPNHESHVLKLCYTQLYFILGVLRVGKGKDYIFKKEQQEFITV